MFKKKPSWSTSAPTRPGCYWVYSTKFTSPQVELAEYRGGHDVYIDGQEMPMVWYTHWSEGINKPTPPSP